MKMLMEMTLPKMGELLVMMMNIISPSGREAPPAELLRWRAKVLLPKFGLEKVTMSEKYHGHDQGHNANGVLGIVAEF